MARKTKRKSYGAYKHNEAKVLKATIKGVARKADVSVLTYRTIAVVGRGGEVKPGHQFVSSACVRTKKASPGHYSNQRSRGRCAEGTGESPTESMAAALRNLGNKLK